MSDDALVAALRAGDEVAFAALVDRWGPDLLRLARLHAPSLAVAEEVVQETWLAVFRGVGGFEGRSSLRTWVFGILLNQARAHARRERRFAAFATLRRRAEEGRAEPAVSPHRFQGRGGERPGWWADPPAAPAEPQDQVEAAALADVLQHAVAGLPRRQREAFVLRDVLGVSAEEACTVLQVSEGNQRVLLHRARSKVREALERYAREAEAVPG